MSKHFSLFINFDGNCREALDFYARVFKSEVKDLMTYGEMPPEPDFTIPDAVKDNIMYSSIPIFGIDVMFCDVPADMPLTKGDNISPALVSDEEDEVRRIFAALSDGGEVHMDLEKTFWSELYGMVQDKFGVIWQLNLTGADMEENAN